ncbi:MAG: hypothetical protein CV090_10440 [Nitrospira sp. WS238]|nr:hypothetical protein [Nitrospira sp. WS238]
MIALEADIGTLMPITATGEPGLDSSVTKAKPSRIAPLTIDEIPIVMKFRDHIRRRACFLYHWEGDE